ncbi:hypothetical protein ACFVAV_27690 [Nocardia sp. NPDC057663]|uniref:hypothetical protein n=1 Tax=Nocardia sp. NPDC057663 TaxID=3346201 RepID=UPI00366D37C3
MSYFDRQAIVLYITACTISAGVGGCSSNQEQQISHLSQCANIAFPEGADVVWYEHDTRFRESTSVAVVDIPNGSIDDFKQRSGFAEFAPGVPLSWKSYWDTTQLNDPLTTDAGNEHSIEGYRDPRRYVVIHDGGGETRRVFIHTDC